ncbi:unnamed protein product [Callosobruchus maculatus]|uniref:Uncharacterized protein n=1 Tax=Callosobruchus maculatus TaxID=64391 RepID=A0A653DL23_CALMS|nr:unnamed protein product [Callosobruchus maculatus]
MPTNATQEPTASNMYGEVQDQKGRQRNPAPTSEGHSISGTILIRFILLLSQCFHLYSEGNFNIR